MMTLIKRKLKSLIIVNFIILVVLLVTTGYVHFSYPNFSHQNIENITKIKDKLGSSEHISFVILGNINNSISMPDNKMISNINRENVDFIISSGNAVIDGAESKYRDLNKGLTKLNCPSIIGVGEKEVSDNGLERFNNHYGETNFSFALKDSGFIFLDTTNLQDISWQKQWLHEELKSYKDLKYKFIIMNKSAYPIQVPSTLDSTDKYIKDKSYREYLMDLFSQYGVTAVFASNVEGYDTRTIKGVTYYTSGGAGGVLTQSNNFYHYIRINVYPGRISIKMVPQGKNTGDAFYQLLDTIRIYMLSIFSVNLFSILILTCTVSLISLVVYSKIFISRDYYRHYEMDDSKQEKKIELKVAMFTNNYLPFIGGVPISIKRLADGLRRLGQQVVVFAPQYDGEKESKEDVIRCKRLIFPPMKGFGFPVVNIFSPRIKREFKLRKFDVVHVHHPFWMGKIGLKLAQRSNLPVVLTYHTRLEQYSHNIPVFKTLFKNVLSHIIIRRFSQKCDAIIAPTASALEYLRNIGVSRHIEVLLTGVDIDCYPLKESDVVKAIRNSYLGDRELLLCSVSRLSKEKNLYFLLEGIKYVKEHTNRSFKCLLIGTGPERDNLMHTIKQLELDDTIELTGSKTPEEIYQYYVASDIFVFASQSETQGMVLLEAMAGKCPAVSVRSSGIDDVVEDGSNGYKTKADAKEWAERVIELMEDTEERERIGENAFQFAKQHSVKEMSQKALKLYEKVIHERKSETKYK